MGNSPEERIIQIIPGGGWMVCAKDDDGDEISQPVVCWALYNSGEIRPHIQNELGTIDATFVEDGITRFYHPDEVC
jgi:hypothetical protein